MLPINKKMQDFLNSVGVKAIPKYLEKGSLFDKA